MEKHKFKFVWPLVANTQVTEFLEKSMVNSRIAGTYVFYGPDNLGKTTTARYFAQCLLCRQFEGGKGILPCGKCTSCVAFGQTNNKETAENMLDHIGHGDFHIIRLDKNKKNISIEQVREFIRLLKMSSFGGSFKIGIVKHAEALSEEAANALLKTLEEPNNKTIIILIANDKEALLPTIVSRSQLLKFMPVKSDVLYQYLIDKHNASRSMAKNIAWLSLGRPALAVKFLENKEFYDKYKKQVEIFLNFFEQDINGRITSIREELDIPKSGQEATKSARRVLDVWQGVARDGLLFFYRQTNLLQHQFVRDRIEFLSDKITPKRLLDTSRNINLAHEYLDANISASSVLENIAINI